jgi:hypothetical protein
MEFGCETEASSHTGCLIVHHIHRSVRIDEFHVIQQFKAVWYGFLHHTEEILPRKLYLSVSGPLTVLRLLIHTGYTHEVFTV